MGGTCVSPEDTASLCGGVFRKAASWLLLQGLGGGGGGRLQGALGLAGAVGLYAWLCQSCVGELLAWGGCRLEATGLA